MKQNELKRNALNSTCINDKLQIENKYASVITLINSMYPTGINKQTQYNKKKQKYLCLHPHCDRRYYSKGALRFHLSKSHLINNSKKPILDLSQTNFINYSNNISFSVTAPLVKSFTIIHKETIKSKSPSPTPSNNKSIKKLSIQAQELLNSIYPPLQCPCCKQDFNRKTNVLKHLAEIHFGQEPYRCVYKDCHHPKIYATREGLIYHILRAHDHSLI